MVSGKRVKKGPYGKHRIRLYWVAIDPDMEERFKKQCKRFNIPIQYAIGKMIDTWVEAMERKNMD